MDTVKIFIKFFNPILLMLIAYITKMIMLTPSFQDTIIVCALSIMYTVSLICIKYFDIKEKVIEENKFRIQVNNDISDLKSKLAGMNFKQQSNTLLKR